MDDTYYTYNSTPYNYQDQAINPNNNNYMGVKPSYRYKNSKILWLNSAFNSTRTPTSGTTWNEISWDVRPFQLYNRTKVKVVSYISNESTARPIIIKVKNLQVLGDSTYNSDNDGNSTLFINHTGVASQSFNNYHSLTLVPQQITNITITLSDSLSVRNNGFTISAGGAGHFVIGLLFEDDDLIADNTISQFK